ncbi:hypothetical protein VTO42DRAFT_1884 [Malbranchea cinnamomea]
MTTTPVKTFSGGTGSRLAKATIIVAGVAALVASLVSIVSIWLQTKNYRKPLLQRYVVRILLMVPIYAVSSWTSIVSLRASSWIVPIRDIYEAFTIYTFFQLLINFLGGERALISMTHGRPPVQHAWPLNQCLPKVDISDPHTFLGIKRGILQYAWLKPILAFVTIVMKATGTYQEGYLGITSGYLWTGIVYNISVTVSLYSLALFWVCMHDDLKPFRPVPKFLCVKLIIFASYWQGFFLSILQWLGALDNGLPGYTPDNLAAAIQDSLICFEMPVFALTHWYAFSWHDYADSSISAARMPVKYALRDAFGIRDLIEDSKMTFRGEQYQYRFFDSGDHVMPHEESNSRLARVMDGMRYERGGKGKYWIPKPGQVNSRTPLLGSGSLSSRSSHNFRSSNTANINRATTEIEDVRLDDEDERLFESARLLEFGDWNYPVITANQVLREEVLPSPLYVAPAVYGNRDECVPEVKQGKRRSRRVPQDNEIGTSSSTVTANKSKRPVAVDTKRDKSSSMPHSAAGKADLVDLLDDSEPATPVNGLSYHAERASERVEFRDDPNLIQSNQTAGNGLYHNVGFSPAAERTNISNEEHEGDQPNERLFRDYGTAFEEERNVWS